MPLDTLLKKTQTFSYNIETIRLDGVKNFIEDVFASSSFGKAQQDLVHFVKIDDGETCEARAAIWDRAFFALESHVAFCLQCGAHCAEYWQGEGKHQERLYDVLIRNHGRACQIAKEILWLMRGGYPDGAISRWRSLYEITVICKFIDKHGEDCAERYWYYKDIERFKRLKKVKEYAEKLKLNRSVPSDSDLSSLSENVDSLLSRFGKGYQQDGGWAAKALNKPSARISFTAIEADVGFDHWRPYYSIGNSAIHGGPHALLDRLGQDRGNPSLVAVGPSFEDMAVPGQNTAISLMHLTIALLKRASDLREALFMLCMVEKMNQHVCQTFVGIAKQNEAT